MTIQWHDTPERYGLISRTLHWGMAAIFAWQFLGMAARLAFGRTPFVSTLIGTHSSIGALLFVLVLVRIFWGLTNNPRRPAYQQGFLGLFAKIGHWSLYALMVIVPLLALVRTYGSGRAFQPFGIPLFTARDDKIEWLIAPGSALHGVLAWTLLALIVGHVSMVLIHRFILRDSIASRMLSGRQRTGHTTLTSAAE